jgi:hypothetical protein
MWLYEHFVEYGHSDLIKVNGIYEKCSTHGENKILYKILVFESEEKEIMKKKVDVEWRY